MCISKIYLGDNIMVVRVIEAKEDKVTTAD